jgi:hypothetical protein
MDFHDDVIRLVWHGVNHLVVCETSYIICQNRRHLMTASRALTIVYNVIDLAILPGMLSEMRPIRMAQQY